MLTVLANSEGAQHLDHLCGTMPPCVPVGHQLPCVEGYSSARCTRHGTLSCVGIQKELLLKFFGRAEHDGMRVLDDTQRRIRRCLAVAKEYGSSACHHLKVSRADNVPLSQRGAEHESTRRKCGNV